MRIAFKHYFGLMTCLRSQLQKIMHYFDVQQSGNQESTDRIAAQRGHTKLHAEISLFSMLSCSHLDLLISSKHSYNT